MALMQINLVLTDGGQEDEDSDEEALFVVGVEGAAAAEDSLRLRLWEEACLLLEDTRPRCSLVNATTSSTVFSLLPEFEVEVSLLDERVGDASTTRAVALQM
jgi:hypothetical protein